MKPILILLNMAYGSAFILTLFFYSVSIQGILGNPFSSRSSTSSEISQRELEDFQFEVNHGGNIDFYLNQLLEQIKKSQKILDPLEQDIKKIKDASEKIRLHVIQNKKSDINIKVNKLNEFIDDFESNAKELETSLARHIIWISSRLRLMPEDDEQTKMMSQIRLNLLTSKNNLSRMEHILMLDMVNIKDLIEDIYSDSEEDLTDEMEDELIREVVRVVNIFQNTWNDNFRSFIENSVKTLNEMLGKNESLDNKSS